MYGPNQRRGGCLHITVRGRLAVAMYLLRPTRAPVCYSYVTIALRPYKRNSGVNNFLVRVPELDSAPRLGLITSSFERN